MNTIVEVNSRKDIERFVFGNVIAKKQDKFEFAARQSMARCVEEQLARPGMKLVRLDGEEKT